MINTILFDLDGTLLPMDQEEFTRAYFGLLAKKLLPLGYEPEKLVKALWRGVEAMVSNDGSRINEERFWESFSEAFGEKCREDIPVFEEFYRKEFGAVKEVCGYNPEAGQTVRRFRQMGFRVALATNPIFPAVATRARMGWVDLAPEDFEYYTTYENSRFCKPNLEYYREITEKLGVSPRECLMVGNDVTEDMAARKLGMEVFLLTDCLINKEDKDLAEYPRGGFEELVKYMEGCRNRK